MNLRGAYNVLTAFFYVPWFVDLIIAAGSLLFVLVIVVGSIVHRQLADLAYLILGLIALLYGAASFITKRNNDRKELDVFKIKAANVFENCRNMAVAYYPEVEDSAYKPEDRLLKTFLGEWKKYGHIRPFEYRLIDGYLDQVVADNGLEESDRLFLKYRIISSDMSSHFPVLVGELENGDYFTNGAAHNQFIKKVYLLSNGLDVSQTQFVLDDEKIQDTISIALKKSNPIMEQLLKETQARERIQYLLNKCYENAYSNMGNLDKELSDDSRTNLTLLYRYDERFGILKLKWRTEIKKHLAKKFSKQKELDAEFMKEKEQLDNIIMPQPLSRAISDFGHCIERLARRDAFLFVVYPDKFGDDASGWSVQRFIDERVIPRAHLYLEEFNGRLVKAYPFLKKFQKKSLDANYYLLFLSRQHFEYHADQDSIPTAIKRFIVKTVLESENATDHLASQLVYVKQVINSISISGLLFTESLETQKSIQEKETEILARAKNANLRLGNIHEIASIGNQLPVLVRTIYQACFGAGLVRKHGKKYAFADKTAAQIMQNAIELLQLFEALKTSAST